MDTPNIQVKEAAASELRALSRTSFSSEGFTREQIEAISSAIEAAIREYDRQMVRDNLLGRRLCVFSQDFC